MTQDVRLDGFTLAQLAPAKVNLALHVVGQKDNGHHLLESIVTFADAGDRIGFRTSDIDVFSVSGRFAGAVPATDEEAEGNLVLKARNLLRAHLVAMGHAAPPVHLHLEKNLPVASGIGGGSADAAATLRGLMQHWQALVDAAALSQMALTLGADVPMCLASRPLMARGIGEDIAFIGGLPALSMLLVNPLVAVSTPVIFRMLTNKVNAPLTMPDGIVAPADWVAALQTMRNDLEPPARAQAPLIARVSDALAAQGASLVRMSGSGATCFGLFPDRAHRDTAAARLSALNPGWYILACNSIASTGDPT